MKLKTITIIALIGVVYCAFIHILYDTHLLDNIGDVVIFGREGAKAISVDRTAYLLYAPYSFCFYIFFTVFFFKIKDCVHKWVGHIAFVIWCINIAFSILVDFRQIYLAINFDGETFLSFQEWRVWVNGNTLSYLILFGNAMLDMQGAVVAVLSEISLIILFAFTMRKDRTFGIVGIVAMTLLILSVLQVWLLPGLYLSWPFLHYIWLLGWLALFATTLWRIEKQSELLSNL